MTVGRKLKRNIFIDTDIDCQNCGSWQRVCTWNGECDNLEPMTNEEWLKSLDTEGLVDYLYEVHKGGNSVERQRWIENHKERVKMQFRGWLKEKHE